MYDCIVIGSGIGGLAAAGLLARVADKRVLVLEKHIEPGGLTHVFRRDGASWDVGVHYVGDMGPEDEIFKYFDYLSGGELKWNRMPHGFDRFVYPGVDFTVPSDPDEYRDKLIQSFPNEERAIRRYFRDIQRACRWYVLRMTRGMMPSFVAPVLSLIEKLTGRTATGTTGAYLNQHFRSPELRALLASQWGDYGLPPSRSAFAMHALVINSYLNGAWFPADGSARIARTIERTIERAGGAVRVGQEVVEILVEDGRAVGVRVIDRRSPNPKEVVYRAPTVISNIGAGLTFEKLLPTEGKVGKLTAQSREVVRSAGPGSSSISVYLRLKDSPRTIGVEGENLWVYRSLDHDSIAANVDAHLFQGRPDGAFVSFPSIKAGDENHHTAEILTFVDPTKFAEWRGLPREERGADYAALKQRVGEGLIKLADSAAPGFADLVERFEVSTPLTVEHFTSHPEGTFYGIPATPARYHAHPVGPRTPIPGLLLSGQDAASLGVAGALMGGVAAASVVLGSRGYPTIQGALKNPKPIPVRENAELPPDKYRATVSGKRRLTPSIWELVLDLDAEVDDWTPGQFARLHVGNDSWRDYSIASLQVERVKLLVSTRTGGLGSQYADSVEIGSATTIELPLGQYGLTPKGRHRVFVATGTGLAPFLPMFARLEETGELGDATLIIGCRGAETDLTRVLDGPLPGHVLRCYSRGDFPDALRGRVTDLLGEFDFEPNSTEFYLCGSSAMVTDCRVLLQGRGAKHLLAELY